MDPVTFIGVTGAGIILAFFLLNQFQKVSHQTLLYDSANFIGGSLLLVYAFLISSLPFAILNGVWSLVSLRDIVSDIRRKSA